MVDTQDLINQKIVDFLKNLGLNQKEASIYLTLLAKGSLTILELSCVTGIPRTNTYRMLENLKKIGLVEEIVEENRKLAKAADLTHLEFLFNEQQEKAKTLEHLYPEIKTFLKEMAIKQQPGTKVLFYRGKDSLKRQLWNETKARGEVVGFIFLTYDDIADSKFAQKIREELYLRKINGREIISDNDKYLNRESVEMTRKTRVFKYYQWRYLPYEKVNINHNVLIYNNVVSFYTWFEGEIVGVEIYNETFAIMQKQLFEILWSIAEEPEVVLKRKGKEQKQKKSPIQLPPYITYES